MAWRYMLKHKSQQLGRMLINIIMPVLELTNNISLMSIRRYTNL